MSQSSGPVARVETLSSVGSFDRLVREVTNAVPVPVNVLQVAALLETAGVTDAIAQHRHGYDGVFALADDVHAASLTYPVVDDRSPAGEEVLADGAGRSPSERRAMVVNYLRGPFSLLPLVVLSLMMSVYQSYGGWSSGRVFVLSAATIGSLLVTSGFVQVAARKGSIYLSQGYVHAARSFVTRTVLLALLAVGVTAALLTAAGSALGLLGVGDRPLLVTAYVMLSTLWLLSGVLSILGRVLWFGLALVIGAAGSYGSLVALEAVGTRVDLVVPSAAGIGFGLAALVMVAVILRAFRAGLAATSAAPQRVVTPPRAQLVVGLAPYFIYGVAYLLNVLSGHVGGWVGRLPEGVDRIEAVAVSEMGLTLALTAYMLVGGVAEHTMQRFWQRVKGYQALTRAVSPQAFGARIGGFYRGERVTYLLALLISTVGVGAGAALISSDRSFLGIAWDGSLGIVFLAGTLGYGLLALGVFDAMLLITLSRPRFALEALGVGLLVTTVVSLWAGHTFTYAHGALGTVVGGLAFLVVARSRLHHLVRRADYYYYASF